MREQLIDTASGTFLDADQYIGEVIEGCDAVLFEEARRITFKRDPLR